MALPCCPHLEAAAEVMPVAPRLPNTTSMKSQDVANEKCICGIPTLLVYKNGVVVGQHLIAFIEQFKLPNTTACARATADRAFSRSIRLHSISGRSLSISHDLSQLKTLHISQFLWRWSLKIHNAQECASRNSCLPFKTRQGGEQISATKPRGTACQASEVFPAAPTQVISRLNRRYSAPPFGFNPQAIPSKVKCVRPRTTSDISHGQGRHRQRPTSRTLKHRTRTSPSERSPTARTKYARRIKILPVA